MERRHAANAGHLMQDGAWHGGRGMLVAQQPAPTAPAPAGTPPTSPQRGGRGSFGARPDRADRRVTRREFSKNVDSESALLRGAPVHGRQGSVGTGIHGSINDCISASASRSRDLQEARREDRRRLAAPRESDTLVWMLAYRDRAHARRCGRSSRRSRPWKACRASTAVPIGAQVFPDEIATDYLR